MRAEIFSSQKERNSIGLDPRTKLLLLLTIAIFVLGGAGGDQLTWARILLAVIPVILVFFSGKWISACGFIGLLFVGCFFQYFLLQRATGILNILVLATAGVLSTFIPGIAMGYYAVTTTTVSEFVAAMERMHMPEQIIIPLSVMLRFFPTVGEEASGISDAMRMRGISFGGKHPGKMLEYRLVPLMTCSVKIGEELSAAALTRGLGGTKKRTNVCKIGLGFCDLIFIILCGIIILYWLFVMIGGIF